MKQRIYSAIKHFALSAAFRGLSQRKRHAAFDAPEPRKQPAELPSLDVEDMWMFDRAAKTAVAHRMDMLANEMDRLSGTLNGLRAFLGSVASEAPMLADYEITPRAAPMIIDRDLFDGEPITATPNAIPAAGEASFLFEEDSALVGQFAEVELRARAA